MTLIVATIKDMRHYGPRGFDEHAIKSKFSLHALYKYLFTKGTLPFSSVQVFIMSEVPLKIMSLTLPCK